MKSEVERLVSELARAWNTGDAQAFAAVFADDAEQVNIFGRQLHGRIAIAEQHDRIFKTVFRDSTNVFDILDWREVAPGIIFAQISSVVAVPEGPLRGELHTIGSLLLRRATAGHWDIMLFHNTRVSPGP